MLEFLLFLIVIIGVFYLPGKLFLSKLRLHLSSPEDIFFSIGTGLVLFLIVAYALSWVHGEVLLYPLYLIIDYIAIRSKVWRPTKLSKQHIKPLTLVLVLSFLFSLSMLVTGKWGDTFVSRHDDWWHLALINELRVNFPPDSPGASELPLSGYHFFYDFIVARLSNLFSLSPMNLHFHFMPLLIAFLWGTGVYSLTFVWSKKISVALWSVFLTMFGGSFAFILVMQGHPEVNLSSGLGMDQPAISLYNAPFAMSIVWLLVSLFALYNYLRTRNKHWLVPLVLAVGTIAMVKVYAGIILLGGVLILSLIDLLKKRFSLLVSLVPIAFLFFSTYWVFAANAGHLVFYPFWEISILLKSFSWYGYNEKMYTYTKFHITKGIIETQLYGSMLLIGNLGTRLIGILIILGIFLRKRTRPSLFAFTVFCMATISIVIPILFFQSGRVFEIVQMMWYFLFFCSLFAAFGFAALFSWKYPKVIKIAVFIVILTVTLPSTYGNFQAYYSLFVSRTNMSDPYFQTMHFLLRQANYDATVLELPPKETTITRNGLDQWYKVSTPALSAFANKRSYFTNQFQDISKSDYNKKMKLIAGSLLFLNASDTSAAYPLIQKKFMHDLTENDIAFIYTSYETPQLDSLAGIKKIYQNGQYAIYKVN